MKNFGEKGAWAYPETAQIFSVPPIISRTDKATNFKFGRCIQSVHANKSPLKIWEKRERGRIQGLPKVFEYPLLSQECVKLRTSNLAGIFTRSRPSEQKPFKNLAEKGAWAHPGTAEFFEYSLLSQERVKLRTSNFARTFLVSIAINAHYKFREK